MSGDQYVTRDEMKEEIRRAIYDQPSYRYARLKEAGQRLMLTLHKHETADLKEWISGLTSNDQTDFFEQIEILEKEYGWIEVKDSRAAITEGGREGMNICVEFVYGRWA